MLQNETEQRSRHWLAEDSIPHLQLVQSCSLLTPFDLLHNNIDVVVTQ